MKVFLDDDRNHSDLDWTIVRTVPHLMTLIDRHGDEISELSFDNDLRQPQEGWEAVRDIVDRRVAAEQDGKKFLPALRSIYVHSANGEAASNMIGRLDGAARAGYFAEVTIEHRPATLHAYPLAYEDTRRVNIFEGEATLRTGSRNAAVAAFANGMGR